MRGPNDDLIGTQMEVGAKGVAAQTERPPRPAGGKPLLRMLSLLASAGYDETAREVIDQAVPPESQVAFAERAAAFLSLPAGASTGGRRARRTATKASERAGTETGALAQESMDAANRLGPPSPTGPQWRSLGPSTIPNGQTYGSSRVNVSGRVAAIAVDPSRPAHVLVGAANGGVWETFDRGATWAPRTDYAATLAVGALAFDPGHPATVYCGTGEGNWWSWLGAGVLRSTDGGTTWATLCTAPFVGQGFFDLVVHPADGKRLLASTTSGLYVSIDGGATWTQRRAVRTWSISIAPTGGAKAEIIAACSDGLQRSTNGGTSWTAVNLPGAPAGFTRLAAAIAPSNGVVAYAWGAGAPQQTDGSPTPYLWRRAAGGWTAQATPPGVATGQSWYDWFLAVAPDDANEIYCGAISVHRGDLAGTTWTWRDIATKSSGDSIHPDQHAIAFEPGRPASVYVGNDGGLFLSSDRGTTWQHRNNGLEISEFEYLAQNPGSSRWLIGGTQDNGSQRWQGSPTWDHVADGDGGDCGVNRTTPTTVFHTYYGMSPERSATSGNWASWTWVGPPVPAGEGSPFYPPFECSASTGDTIAIGGNALYASRNNGTAWTRIAYPGGGSASAMHIPDGDTIYVGLGDGRILKTTWSGTGWGSLTALTTPRASAAVSDIQVEPGNASRIWVTHFMVGGGRVFRSTDGGTTWTDLSAGLPNLSITAIALDPANPNRAWISASLGVYQTTDAGGSWSSFASALPNAYVGDLIFHPQARVLRAGTRNRGVWEIPVDGWPTQPTCAVQWTGSLQPHESKRWFTFNWPATWHMIWTVMPTTPGSGQVTWNVAVERASAEFVTYWITVTNTGATATSFEGRYCILSRY